MAGIWFDATYKAVVKRDTPSLYWPLNATDGGTDQSGNSRTGTASGGVTIGGFAGSPLTDENTSTDFDNSNDAVTSTYQPFVSASSRTFTGWFFRTDTSGFDTLIGSASGSPGAMQLYGASGATDIVFAAPSGSDSFTAAMGTGAWHHIALRFSAPAASAELLVDGVSQGVKTTVTDFGTNTTLQIGTFASGGDPYGGHMSHIAVFEYLLHDDRIKAHVAAATA